MPASLRSNEFYVTGGGAYNELMMQIKASILNQTLNVVSVKEATALGAAVLGGVGAGVYPVQRLCANFITPKREIANRARGTGEILRCRVPQSVCEFV